MLPRSFERLHPRVLTRKREVAALALELSHALSPRAKDRSFSLRDRSFSRTLS